MLARKSKIRSGATIVEAVIILPVIFLLVFGIMQLAICFSDSIQLNYLAYQTSRLSFWFQSKEDIVNRSFIKYFLPKVTVDKGYSYEQGGIIYNVFDVSCNSPVIIPMKFEDSEGNLIFPPEGVKLHARGFCPMPKAEE